MYLNGAAYLYYMYSQLTPGAQEDFTLDMRFKPIQTASMMLWAQGTAGDPLIYLRLHNSNLLQFVAYSAGTMVQVVTVVSAVSNTQFHHVAVTRASNITRLFLDGSVLASTHSVWNYPQIVSNHNTWIGCYATGQQCFKGYLEEIRMCKGVAMWSADFTPPDGPYTWENTARLPITCSLNAPKLKAPAAIEYGQRFRRDLVTKNIDLTTDTVRACLMSAGFYFDVDTHKYWADVVGNEIYISRDTLWEEAGASHTSYLIKAGASTAVDSWVGILSATGLSGLSTLSGGSYGVNRWGSNRVVYFDGASTGLTISANTISFGSQAFTIDYWLKMASIPVAGQYMMTHVHMVTPASRRIYHGIYFSGTSTAILRLYGAYNSVAFMDFAASFTPSYNVSNNLYSYWHYAVTRGDNGSFHFFINGWSRQCVNTTLPSAGYSIPTIGGSFQIHYNSQYFIKGNLEEYRIVTGQCLWSANFTPPMSTITLSVVSYCGQNLTATVTEDDSTDGARIFFNDTTWQYSGYQSIQGMMLYDFNTSTIIGFISMATTIRKDEPLVTAGVTIKVS
jgi:hypothetical protein